VTTGRPRRVLSASSPTLEVAQILENFLEGTGGPWDWDDFISVGDVADERLRQIQQHVNLLSEEFPPEKPGEFCNQQGRDVIRSYIVELRSR